MIDAMEKERNELGDGKPPPPCGEDGADVGCRYENTMHEIVCQVSSMRQD